MSNAVLRKLEMAQRQKASIGSSKLPSYNSRDPCYLEETEAVEAECGGDLKIVEEQDLEVGFCP